MSSEGTMRTTPRVQFTLDTGGEVDVSGPKALIDHIARALIEYGKGAIPSRAEPVAGYADLTLLQRKLRSTEAAMDAYARALHDLQAEIVDGGDGEKYGIARAPTASPEEPKT